MIEYLALSVSVTALILSGYAAFLQVNERLANDRSALLSAQIALGQETIGTMTTAVLDHRSAMDQFLGGNEEPLTELHLKEAELINRNLQIMPVELAAHVNAFFAQLQKASAACAVSPLIGRSDGPGLADLAEVYRQAHGVEPTAAECQSQLVKNDERGKAYIAAFRAMMGLAKLDETGRAFRGGELR